MPWVCGCGQRNIVNGLACLACERLPEDETQPVEVAGSARPGFRFREDPPEVVEEVAPAEEPPAPGRRFRFTVPEPELTEVQSRDTGSSDSAVGATSSTSAPTGFRFSDPVEDLEPIEELQSVPEAQPFVDAALIEDAEPLAEAALIEDVQPEETFLEDPVFDEPLYEELGFAEQVYEEPAVDQQLATEEPATEAETVDGLEPSTVEPAFDEASFEAMSHPAPVEVGEEDLTAHPAWPEFDRRAQDRRHDDRRTFDSGVNPGELDDRVDTYLPEAGEGDEDPWTTMRNVIGASLAPAASPATPPATPVVNDEDPWEAFRRAREEYEAELESAKNAPIDELAPGFANDVFDPSTAFEALQTPPPEEPVAPAEPVSYSEPVFAQPVEEFEVPTFEVDAYEVDAIDDHDPILEEVMRHDPNALTDDDFAAFPTPWGAEVQPEAGEQPSFDHDWARWEQEQANPQQSSPAPTTAWTNEDDGVWSTDAIADAHGDWSTVPREWTAEVTPWSESAAATPAPLEEDHEDDAWTQQEDPWTASGEDPWELPATDDPWSQATPVAEPESANPWVATPQQAVPQGDGDMWVTPQEPGAQDDPWATPTEANDDPWSASTQAGVDDDPWNAPAQSLVDDDPWNAPQADATQQPLTQDDPWATPVVGDDDPWNAPQEPVSYDDPWNSPQSVEANVDPWNAPQEPVSHEDPWNAPQSVEVDDDPWTLPAEPATEAWAGEDDDPWNETPQQPAASVVADDSDDEQPWWAEQSGFGTQYEQDETNLPYFDDVDSDPSTGTYDFEDEPAYATPTPSPMSEYFDEAADLDEPDPFELDDDWTLPDETPRGGRNARSLDREPQRGRGGRPSGKSSNRSTGKKKPPPRRKPAKQNTGGGFKLPFGSGSTVVTVLVIAIAIVALSLLFKDAFQRVGAATNPDGTTAVAASCADSPSTTSDIDLAAATVAALDNATLVPDHEAGTGTIDFTRALAAEPDPSMALTVLDQSRFERGYDRMFNVKKNGTIHLSVYQFKGSLCAQEYLELHPVSGNTFSVTDIAGSAGQVTQSGPKAFTGKVQGAIGDSVVIVEVAGVATADAARTTLQSVLTKQIVALRTAGVQ
jgi:hypothetical protein